MCERDAADAALADIEGVLRRAAVLLIQRLACAKQARNESGACCLPDCQNYWL